MKPMTVNEFNHLVNYIKINNSPLSKSTKGKFIVKYIDPHIDMRTGTIFALTLRGYAKEVTFHTQNEMREIREDLDVHIINYLERGNCE